MPIVFARVDDRLIHGQVVQAWLPELNIDEVLIPVPKGQERTVSEGLLRLSLPYEYQLSVLPSHVCMRHTLDNKQRIFVLANSLQALADLIEDGLQIKSINIGGMHFKENAQKLADNVFLDENDKRLLKIIHGLGIRVETRAVPNAQSISLAEVFL